MQEASGARAMTVREVARYLNVNEKTVYRLVQRRELPGFRVAAAWRFQRVDLDAWIESQKQARNPEPSPPPLHAGRRLRQAD